MLNITQLFNSALSVAFVSVVKIFSGIFHGLWQPEVEPSYLSGRYVMIPVVGAEAGKR